MARLLGDMAVSTQQPLDRMDPPCCGPPAMKRCTGRRWAIANGYAVFTHDLDFVTMLALSGADGPSVLQVRCLNVLPEAIGTLVL